MHLSRGSRWFLRLGTAFTLLFIYFPIAVIVLYAFNARRIQTWPIKGLTFDWFEKAWHNPGLRDALATSAEAALGATAIAMVLGSLAAYAVARYRFFGRETVSFLVILPIALPGIVTGMALNATFTQALKVDLALWTIVVAHATFCVVMVFNNVVVRLRRTAASLEDAAADLGAAPRRAFRDVTFPQMRSALIAGGLLAFALS
ncbi:MAG: spermidine/putrescine transporter permease, partial [Solirubrobacterales bacterium]|nr:spermidine/putrescine transporter permease [Solirubrobacterales bacterium]